MQRSLPRATFSSSRLPFGGRGGSILAPREHFGGPWEQLDGLERFWNRMFIDFGVIWGTYFVSISGTKAANFDFVRVRFQSLFVPILDSTFRRPGLQDPCYCIEVYCKTQLFIEIICYRFRSVALLFFGFLGSSLSDFCCLETGLEIDGFSVV